MDLEDLRTHILQATEKLQKDNVVKLRTTVRVGYFISRYSCEWPRGAPEPPIELVKIMDEAGTPQSDNPHIRLLYFVTAELYRINATRQIIPLQRRPPSIESRWYMELAEELAE